MLNDALSVVRKMELDRRTRQILYAVIDLYTRTGEPVGSKALCEALDFPVSSATVRKEMSELSEMGYLEQPHTSAGRVPSARGYRLYLDSMLCCDPLTEEEKKKLNEYLPRIDEPDKMLEAAGRALVELTDYAVLSTTPEAGQDTIRRVELIPLGRQTAMLVLQTSGGVVRTRLCRGPLYTPELCEAFSRFTREHIRAIPLSKFTPADAQTLAVSSGGYVLLLAPLITALCELCGEAGKTQVRLEGETKLFGYKEFLGERAEQIFHLLSDPKTLGELMRASSDAISILLGSESRHSELEGTSLLISTYDVGRSHGHFGIIGPIRMDYPKMIPAINYYTQKLGKLLSQIMEQE